MSYLLDLIKSNPLLAGALSLGLAVGGYGTYAEISHAQTRENKKTIEQLIEFQREVVAEKQLELELEKQKREYIREGCLSGKIVDARDCKKVGVNIAKIDQIPG